MEKVYIIAEIGINHNGDIGLAKQLIDMAKGCGCDAVKFQKRNPDVCVPEWEKYRMIDTPWGYISYLEYKKRIEFGRKEYDEIDRYCKKKKIVWFASAWDFDSLKFLERYDLSFNKISSAMATHQSFVDVVARQGKKTFISTGMCTLGDIDRVVEIFTFNGCSFVLNHCVSTYPTPYEDLNLRMIPLLRERYGCEVGYSGHENNLLPSKIAVVLGARYIERHITLDRSMWGTDQAASLGKRGLDYLVRDIRLIDVYLGDGVKKVTGGEKLVARKQRYWLKDV